MEPAIKKRGFLKGEGSLLEEGVPKQPPLPPSTSMRAQCERGLGVQSAAFLAAGCQPPAQLPTPPGGWQPPGVN